MLAVFIAFLIIIRWWRKDKGLYHTAWKVKYRDIKFDSGVDRSNKTTVAYYNDDPVVMTKVDKKCIKEDKKLLKEMAILKSLSHIHVTTFVGACVDTPNICVLWEHVGGKGSLEVVLMTSSDSKMDTMRQFSIAMDICNGLQYIHSSQMGVHGDLKASNCLIDSHWVAKITDFGLGTFKKGDKLKQYKTQEDEFKDSMWTAPERLRHRFQKEKESITKESDIYSLGVVLKQILCQNGPYEARMKTKAAKEIVNLVAYPPIGPLMRPHIPEDFRRQSVAMATCTQLIQSCWSEGPKKRPTVRKIVKKLKRLGVTRGKNIWDTMTDMKKRYSSKLCRVVQQVEQRQHNHINGLEWNCSPHHRVPMEIKCDLIQDVMVTVCFWSVVDFTSFACESSPVETVQLLSELDDHINDVIKRFQVCKIDTVCDAHMLVSGWPNPDPRHAHTMADVTLTQLNSLIRYDDDHHRIHDHLKMRIGLNSGPAIVSVVGSVIPKYCVFGDTVCTAAAMESNSLAHRIHISSSTYQHLEEYGGKYVMELRDSMDKRRQDNHPSYWLYGRNADDDQESTF